MTQTAPEPLIKLESIHLRRNGKEILDGVDWTMRPGEHWAVIGANGSGKTTMLQIAGGVLFPTSGTATVLGGRFGSCDLFQLRRRVGWISTALIARLPGSETAAEIVLSGLRATFGLIYEYSKEDRRKAEEALDRVGLPGRADRAFGVLSQGEQQKTLFARSMMADPALYILDEACSGLDLRARESFLATLDRFMANRTAGIIFVTHHIEEIPSGITHALVLADGKVAAAGRTDEALTGPVLSDAFGIPVEVEKKNGRFWARAA